MERNGTERYGTVPENKGIFAGVHTRTTRNVPFHSEKWTALKSEPYNGAERKDLALV